MTDHYFLVCYELIFILCVIIKISASFIKKLFVETIFLSSFPNFNSAICNNHKKSIYLKRKQDIFLDNYNIKYIILLFFIPLKSKLRDKKNPKHYYY